MPYTLESIKFRDIINVTAIPRFVPDQTYPTLEVVGEDFSSVEEVYLNDTLISNYVIVNRNVLWVILPPGFGTLRSIEVVSGNFTKTAVASRVEFKIGDRSRKINGVLKLLQLFTKWLLQSPGSDIYNPRRGGGLRDLIGETVSLDRMDTVLASLTQSIQTTASQIRESQSRAVGLPLNERLLDAVLLNLDRSPERAEVRARVHVVSMAGEEAVSALIL